MTCSGRIGPALFHPIALSRLNRSISEVMIVIAIPLVPTQH